MRLIERVWFHQYWARYVLVPLLLPLSLLFALLTSLRRWCYRVGVKKSVSLPKPVIVIGNIGVGGNGKTPVVIYLIEICRSLGLTPGVISRGYGGSAPYYPYLLDEHSTSNEAGDEPYMIYQRCQVSVAVGADRIATSELLIQQGCDVLLADDGLQHYRLARDYEVIVVDAKRKFGNGLLLPAGPLRERPWRLNSADLVIFNGSHQVSDDCAVMQLQPKFLVNLITGQKLTVDEFMHLHKSINTIAGIGDPQRFFSTLSVLGFNIEKAQGFVDHHHFTADDFTQLTHDVPLVMTEKDAVKCQGFALVNYWYLTVDASFDTKTENKLIEDIKQLSFSEK